VLLALPFAACAGEPRECEPPLDPPDGFTQADELEEEYEDRVGVRLTYQDDRDRLLDSAAGIPGEWGETATVVGEIPLTSGGTAVLMAGVEGIWFALWEQGDRCDPRVVIGNGFERSEFLSVLEDAGITSSQPG
jgi:hypothetical protein